MQKDKEFRRKVRNYWTTMALLVLIIIVLNIGAYIKSKEILDNGYYSITESISQEITRTGIRYNYTFYSKYGDLRKGVYSYSSIFPNKIKLDTTKRYFVAYSATEERSNVLLKNRVVPDSINLDSLRNTIVTEKEWSFWDL